MKYCEDCLNLDGGACPLLVTFLDDLPGHELTYCNQRRLPEFMESTPVVELAVTEPTPFAEPPVAEYSVDLDVAPDAAPEDEES